MILIIGSYCLRASPDVDRTNGFFVAIFQRKKIDSLAIETKTPRDNSDFEQRSNDEESEDIKRSKKRGAFHGDIGFETKPLNIPNSGRKRRRRQLKKPITSS